MAELPRSIFELLGQIATRVDLILIGGFALQAHGVVRQTLDVDCVVNDLSEKLLEEMMQAAGFKRLARTENFARFRHSSLGQLDALFLDGSTFSQMRAASQPHELDGIIFRTPSLSHLIALKLHAMKNDSTRELRDLSDVVELARKNSVAAVELQKLCMQYGPAEIWAKLQPHF
jgi:hypothetical protein